MNKICTSLEQSKKLIELGIDVNTADMHWQYIEEDNGQLQWFCFPKDFSINQYDSIPCWSLIALINVLPSATLDISFDHWFMIKCNEKFTAWHDNPIDVCVEMIEKLHKKMIHDFNNS